MDRDAFVRKTTQFTPKIIGRKGYRGTGKGDIGNGSSRRNAKVAQSVQLQLSCLKQKTKDYLPLMTKKFLYQGGQQSQPGC